MHDFSKQGSQYVIFYIKLVTACSFDFIETKGFEMDKSNMP